MPASQRELFKDKVLKMVIIMSVSYEWETEK